MMEIMKVTKFFRRVGKKISRSKKVEPLSGVFFISEVSLLREGKVEISKQLLFINLIRTLWSLIFPQISFFIPMKPNFAG